MAAKRTTFQSKVVAAIKAEWLATQNIRCAADGSVTYKRSYFYRMGNSSEAMRSKVQAILDKNNITDYVLQNWDAFAQWPKTSYFVVVIRPSTVQNLIDNTTVQS